MDASMTTQLSKLRTLDLKGLQQAYEEAFGKKSKSRNRPWLFQTIARKLQDGAAAQPASDAVAKPTLVARFEKKGRSGKKPKPAGRGKKSEPKKGAQKEPPSRAKPVGERDPRLPKPGTMIEREYKGKKLLVRVLDDGFEYQGKPYRSLSALAMAITGAKAMNGYLFFRLGDYAKKETEKSKS